MHKRTKYLLIFMMSIVLVLAACGNGDSGTDNNDEVEGESDSGTTDSSSDSETSSSDSGDEKTLTVALGTDMVTFDIHNHDNTSTESIHFNMFDYLFERDTETGEIEPHLAEDYEIIDDTTWEIQLKEGVSFHNGEEFDAEDVKYTLERVAGDSQLLEHSHYSVINEVEVLDDYSVRLHLNNPEPALLNRLSRNGSGMLPAEYIEEEGFDHFLENPVGTGPYKYVEWVRDDRIVFEVYEDYFDGQNDEWDELVFRIIPENSTRVSELLTGGVDMAVNVPPSEWDRVDNNDSTYLSQGVSNRTMMIFVRHTDGYPTEDRRVREALDLAIDNYAITENLLGGAGVPTITRVAPGNFGFAEHLYDTYNYDLERAQELLDEAGYPDGFEMTLHSPRGRYLQDAEIAEMVAAMWSQIGVTANVEFMEWGSFVDLRVAQENEDAYLLALGISMFDADSALDYYRHDLYEGQIDYFNEELEELLAAGAENMDREEREEQYIRAQEIIAEDVAHPVLHQESINIGVSNDLEYTPTLDEMIYVDTITRR